MKKYFCRTFLALAVALSVSCAREENWYIKSLGLIAEPLSVVDSINIDQFDLFQARNAVPIGDNWLAVSSVQGDYNLLFLDLKTMEHFFAIRKGRGPGEMLNANSLHKSDEDVILYDYTGGICVKVKISESIRNREVVLDTVGDFSDAAIKPVYLTSCGSWFISGIIADPDTWYCGYDNKGNVISKVSALNVKEVSGNRDRRVSTMLSSVYTSNPEGTKVCVANVICPSISFANVLADGTLSEYKRYEFPPVGMVSGHITEDVAGAFNGACADSDYVYLIFSGNKYKGGELPINECKHLIIYDWDGNPVKYYLLDKNICSVSVAGDTLWGASAYPESCVYKFILPVNL